MTGGVKKDLASGMFPIILQSFCSHSAVICLFLPLSAGSVGDSALASRQRLRALQTFARLRRRLRSTATGKRLDAMAFGAAMGASDSWVTRLCHAVPVLPMAS